MDILQTIILALIQGFTEFLPISSSAHLILPSEVLGWPDQGLFFDVALHLGSLFAVIIYFKKDLKLMLLDWTSSIITKKKTENSTLAWWIILATIPAVIFGFIFKSEVSNLRSITVIASTTIIFGIFLGIADKMGKQKFTEFEAGWKKVLIIGMMQAISIIPGVSRSGITITAGLMVGLTKTAAARFSFLMSIPTILGAAILMFKDIIKEDVTIDWASFILGMSVSFVSAYLCIFFFLKLINKIGMFPFVIYRILLGLFLFYLVYIGH